MPKALPGSRIWGISVLGCTSIIPLLIGPIIVGVLVDFGRKAYRVTFHQQRRRREFDKEILPAHDRRLGLAG